MAASQEGHVEIVELLLQNGADVNARNKYNGKTALMQASKNGHYTTVQLLLKAGSDTNACDIEGSTAEEQVFIADHSAVVQLVQNTTADPNIVPPPRN